MRTEITVSASDIESFKTAAFRKCLAADLCYTVRDRNLLQTAAVPEDFTADLSDPFGKRDVCKAGTPFNMAPLSRVTLPGTTALSRLEQL